MVGKAWAPEETEELRRLVSDGLSHADIGRAVGRSRHAVRNRLLMLSGRLHAAGRICSGCPTTIRDDNISGRCKPCATAFNNRLPETIEKRRTGWRKRLENPQHYADLCLTAKINSRRAMQDPVKRAKAQERARKIYTEYLATPEMRARLNSPELRARRGRKVSEHRMSWCPPEYRALYYEIRRKIAGPASEARAAVFTQIAKDTADLSPFERQMRALERGAKLVANDARPSGNQVVRRVG